ncbi:MAG: tetratricopeptide repeat protein [Balneolaceae bacterium]|nr:tetratricopeptide repeat protein [Balneolaceae bacterium]MBO6546981.1 tetratricopeptide repeat protein [Balneolaceae bacterium]MBO6649341.1 tetratricopeptide repeat protein [Balneolaceae bacterium]
MNNFRNTRLAGLVLAIGFFFACSSSKPSIDSLIAESQYEMALTQIDEQLTEDPNQPGLLIQKGKINTLIAESLDPRERGEFYAEAITSFGQAAEAGIDSAQQAEVEAIKTKLWSEEHNAGTAEFNNQEENNDFSLAKAHFSNAIILKPMEASSHLSLATAHFSTGNVQEAISTLNIAKNTLDEVPQKLYENLGFLYLQHGEPDQSVFYYELANKDVTQSKNIAFGLVNAYISSSNNEKAVDLLSDLVENYPNDAALHNVYGTQLYEITGSIMNDLAQAYQNNDTALVSQIRFEAEGVGEQAEQELIQAYSRDTLNTDYVESLAVFYNNLTGKYLGVHEVAFESDKEALHTKAEILVNFAIEYYEKLTEISPQNETAVSTLEGLRALKESRFSS